MQNENENKFLNLIKKKENQHLKGIYRYAVMDYDKLLEEEGRLYHGLLINEGSDSLGTLILAVEYAKANYSKYLQGQNYEITDLTYTESIESDLVGLYETLGSKVYERLNKDYNRLVEYEKTLDKKYLRNNYFA